MSKKNKNYVNNADLLEELSKYQKTKIVSDNLGRMFLLIAKNFSHKQYFRRYYNDLDDMISEAALSCVKAIDKFKKELNANNPNPFAYFTSVIMRSFLQTIKKKYKHENFKRQMISDYYHEHGIQYKDLVEESMEENKKFNEKMEKYKKSRNNDISEEFLEED